MMFSHGPHPETPSHGRPATRMFRGRDRNLNAQGSAVAPAFCPDCSRPLPKGIRVVAHLPWGWKLLAVVGSQSHSHPNKWNKVRYLFRQLFTGAPSLLPLCPIIPSVKTTGLWSSALPLSNEASLRLEQGALAVQSCRSKDAYGKMVGEMLPPEAAWPLSPWPTPLNTGIIPRLDLGTADPTERTNEGFIEVFFCSYTNRCRGTVSLLLKIVPGRKWSGPIAGFNKNVKSVQEPGSGCGKIKT